MAKNWRQEIGTGATVRDPDRAARILGLHAEVEAAQSHDVSMKFDSFDVLYIIHHSPT